MKKFFILFTAALLVLASGCFKQAEVKSPSDPTESWISGTDMADATEQVEVKTKATAKVEAPAEAAKPEPPAPVQPAAAKTAPAPVAPQPQPATQPAPSRPAPTPEPVTHTVPMGPSGTPGVILRNARTVTYRPAYATWNAGYMFQFENQGSRPMWLSTTGYVTMQPLVGQCMESSRIQPPPPRPETCPFMELQTKTGSWVVLIKPGYKAMFVIDTETCPPDGSGCTASVQAIPYSMEVEPRPERNRRQVRTFEFPKAPKGWRWYL